MENQNDTLIAIRTKIRDCSSVISAADKMPQIDFEPTFRDCVDHIHRLVWQLPDEFRTRHPELVRRLPSDGYHFDCFELDKQICTLVGEV